MQIGMASMGRGHVSDAATGQVSRSEAFTTNTSYHVPWEEFAGHAAPRIEPTPAVVTGEHDQDVHEVDVAAGGHVNHDEIDALLARNGLNDTSFLEDVQFGNEVAAAAPEGTTVTDAASVPAPQHQTAAAANVPA